MIVNISTTSDADFERAFAYKAATSLLPIDLSGSSLHLMARSNVNSAEVSIDASTANGLIVITNAVAGKFLLMFPISILGRLPAREYVHSLIRTRIDGKKVEIWHGEIKHAIGPTRE